MAGLVCSATSGEVALVAATAKTVLQIKAPTNQRVTMKKLVITGKQAAGGTDAPVLVRLTRSTANFGTGTGVTPIKLDPGMGETVQSTSAKNFTVEPTSPTDALMSFEVQPQSGIIEPYGFGAEPKIPGGQSLNIELTSAATPTLTVTAIFEE